MGLFDKKLQYTKDYRTDTVTDEKGREHKKYTYIGPLIPFITDAKTVKKKFIITAVLTVILVVCLIITEGLEHGSAWFALVSIPLAVALFPTLYLIMGVCTLQYNGDRMRRDRYEHSYVRVLKSCAGIIPCVGVGLIADFVYRFMYKDWLFLKEDILFYVMVVIVLTAAVAIVLIVRSVEVDERQLLLGAK